MRAITEPLNELADYEEIQKNRGAGQGLLKIIGCARSQKIHMAYALSDGYEYRLLVFSDAEKAAQACEEYRALDERTVLYLSRDLLFYYANVEGTRLTAGRMEVLRMLAEKSPGEALTVVTAMDALLDGLPVPEDLLNSRLEIGPADVLDLREAAGRLSRMGYERTAQVSAPGQFSVRGGILDIYPLSAKLPVRIEMWGDEVDSLRTFDAETQRSVENIESVCIYPAEENWDGQEETVSFLDYFPREKTLLFLDEPARMQEACEALEEEYFLSLKRRSAGEDGSDETANGRKSGGREADETETAETAKTDLPLSKNTGIGTAKTVRTDSSARKADSAAAAEGAAADAHELQVFAVQEIIRKMNRYTSIGFTVLGGRCGDFAVRSEYRIQTAGVNPYNGNFDLLTKDLQKLERRKYRVLLVCPTPSRAKRLAEDLRTYELHSFYSDDPDRTVKPGEIMAISGNVAEGYTYPMLKFMVITQTDIFGRRQKKKPRRKQTDGERIRQFSELKPGDYVVHENHGLGIFRGIEQIEVEGTVRDYLKIAYADEGVLYIPVTQLDAITKYAAAGEGRPKLNKLGTGQWNRTKSQVKRAVELVAKDLVELYAARQEAKPYVYGKDTVWQSEFEETFPFEETSDQLRAIEDVKRDMESPKIMDRLICGDVGYGKTEVAMRAAFKAVQENRQVVFLVPTTVLAQQHYNTFTQRMKDYPVQIDLLCRFRTKAQQDKTVQDLKKGLVDIVIGTHRVLSADVGYKNLGLLIIDEEQRFGVSHKEKIKKLRKNVDVLSLTATPIPRTLHMSLIGIRDMSVLDEAPQDRMSVQTYVMEYSQEVVREAIERELARGGQVYYVYNRVEDIADVAAQVRALVPQASVAYAHGQMQERRLEDIMYDFINGDTDVLVTTTIVESGLDIPNANTIIIRNAQRFGLAQLYQLRGRVGRSNRLAYAFMMYPKDRMLKEDAQKRLSAVRDFTELGSGIKIAMRDLEIRGAGSLLGEVQSGHMGAVGYDLYCKLLAEAVRVQKGEQEEEKFETAVDIRADAYIPDTYIADSMQKMEVYKRIAAAASAEELEDITEEMTDRFGDPPAEAMRLVRTAALKLKAHGGYITAVEDKGEYVLLKLYENAKLSPEGIPALLEKYSGRLSLRADKTAPCFVYRPAAGRARLSQDALLKNLDAVLGDIAELRDAQNSHFGLV